MPSTIKIEVKESQSLNFIDIRANFLDRSIIIETFSHADKKGLINAKSAFEEAAKKVTVTKTEGPSATLNIIKELPDANITIGVPFKNYKSVGDAIDSALREFLPRPI